MRIAIQGVFRVAAVLFLAACGVEDPKAPAALPPLPELTAEFSGAEAQAEVQKLAAALRQSPLDPQRNAELAMLLHAYERFEAAEALYRRVAALEPDALRWWYYLGVVQQNQGDHEAAAKSFRAALAIDPKHPPLRRRLADTLVTLNEWDKAERLYLSLLQDDPADAMALYGLGRLQTLEGDPLKAIATLKRAVKMQPHYGAAHYALALAYRDAGDAAAFRRHIQLYEENRRSAPPRNDPLLTAINQRKRGATQHIERAIQLERQGDLPGAIVAHHEALEADSNLAQAHVNLVSLYGRTDNLAQAAEHYKKALALNPNQADLHYNFGVLLFSKGRYDEAKKAFEQAVAANPSYAAAHNNLGQVLEREGRIDDAIRSYRRALEAEPGFRLSRFHLGRMLLAKNQPRSAIEQFEKLVERHDAMTPQVLFGLATAYVRLGEVETALRYGRQAQQLARELDQAELATKIAQDLAALR